MVWDNRYFLRLSGIEEGRPTFLALERSADGTFRAPPGAKVAWEARDARASRDNVRATLKLLAERGPLPWDAAIADALASGTGMGKPTAALLWGGSTAPFPPSKEGKAKLGLRGADLEVAELELLAHGNRFLYQEGMPADPARLYTPTVKDAQNESVIDTWVALWNSRDRKRAPLPLELVKQLRSDLGATIGAVHEHARTLVAPDASPEFTEDRAWNMAPYPAFTTFGRLPRGWPVPVAPASAGGAAADEADTEPTCFTARALDAYAVYFAWAALELPYGDATRRSIGRLAALTRQRLQNPELLLVAGWVQLGPADLEQTLPAALERFRGSDYQGLPGRPHAPGYDSGDLVVTWPQPPGANGFYLAVRPAKIDDQASFAKLAARLKLPAEAAHEIVGKLFDLKGKDVTTADRFQRYPTFRSPGFQRLLDDLEADGGEATEGSFAADPRVSASATVRAAMKALKLDEDAATLYLQIAALPDPTKDRVLRYNRWTAARYDAAGGTLVKRELVVSAKQARSTRTLFLPGAILSLGASGRPLEERKAPLYGLVADAAKKQQSVFPVMLPVQPLGDMFAAAWALPRA
jgi:hypothetical protein